MPDSVAIPADKIVNQTMYAKGTVYGRRSTDITAPATYTFGNGDMIGIVYSWVTDDNLQPWWMFYASQADYDSFNPFYVKHDPKLLTVANMDDILAQITAAQEQTKKDQEGLVQYYIEKYAPWIVGGLAAAFVLPPLLGSLSSSRSTVSGMSKKNQNTTIAILALLAAAGIGYTIYKNKKKPTGNQVIVSPVTGEILDTIGPGQVVVPGLNVSVNPPPMSLPESNPLAQMQAPQVMDDNDNLAPGAPQYLPVTNPLIQSLSVNGMRGRRPAGLGNTYTW